MLLAAVAVFVGGLVGGSNASAAQAGHGRAAAGFDPVSYTAVGENEFWVLGSVRCPTGRCFAILRTTDGGGTFTKIAAPALPRAEVTPVLRFASPRDGYAFVTGAGGALFATHDGGATWRRIALGSVLAFATGGRYAYAVTARCSSRGCSALRFERSPVSTDAWSSARMPFVPDGAVVDLTAEASRVWLLGTRAGTGRMLHDVLARSADGGRSFTIRSGPCVPGLRGSLAPAPTSESVVWAVCPTGTQAGAWRSTNGGVSFARVITPPLVNSAVLVPASRSVAVLARNGTGSGLLRTTNGGVAWTRPRTPRRATVVTGVEFTDARVGAALVQTGYDASGKIEIHALWRTTDGGARWSSVRFG